MLTIGYQWSPNYNGSTGTIPVSTGNRMTGETVGPVACHYDQGYQEPECKQFKGNQWMTFYHILHLGNFFQANSWFKSYIAYDDQPLVQYIDLRDHIQKTDGDTFGFFTE